VYLNFFLPSKALSGKIIVYFFLLSMYFSPTSMLFISSNYPFDFIDGKNASFLDIFVNLNDCAFFSS
jgi:hypothetical protein